jgi:voltage-gated potassium channel
MILKAKISDSDKQIKKPYIPFFMLISIIIIGIIGYMIIWKDNGVTFVEALYMVAITITTLGYKEVMPLGDVGKVFTLFIAFGGIGSLFYIFSIAMENLFTIQNLNLRGRKKLRKKIEQMSGHYIIVGFGRVGTLAAYELKQRKEDFVVIARDIKENHNYFSANEIMFIEGDASEDEILQSAGVERAKGIIVATGNSAVTAFVVLSAKSLNPKLNIVARADDDTVGAKLKKAGASRIVNPYSAGGYKLASLAVNPNIVDFFESNIKGEDSGFNMEIIQISDSSPWIGKGLRDLDARNVFKVNIIGFSRGKEKLTVPSADYRFQLGDKILSVGDSDKLQVFESIIN